MSSIGEALTTVRSMRDEAISSKDALKLKDVLSTLDTALKDEPENTDGLITRAILLCDIAELTSDPEGLDAAIGCLEKSMAICPGAEGIGQWLQYTKDLKIALTPIEEQEAGLNMADNIVSLEVTVPDTTDEVSVIIAAASEAPDLIHKSAKMPDEKTSGFSPAETAVDESVFAMQYSSDQEIANVCSLCNLEAAKGKLTRCKSCNKFFCDKHIRKCSVCGAYYCIDHITTTDRNTSVCQACIISCPVCYRVMTKNSMIKCDICGEYYCKKCIEVKGLLKKKATCKKCKQDEP